MCYLPAITIVRGEALVVAVHAVLAPIRSGAQKNAQRYACTRTACDRYESDACAYHVWTIARESWRGTGPAGEVEGEDVRACEEDLYKGTDGKLALYFKDSSV